MWHYKITQTQHYNNDITHNDDRLTTWCMQACGLNPLMVYFDVKTHDIWEENLTIIGDIIYTKNIRTLGFRDTRGGVCNIN